MTEDCGNCRFYKDNGSEQFKEGYGICRRFPELVPTNDGRWCGEHKLIKEQLKPKTTEPEDPCPVCGCEERGQGGYLACECPGI